MGRNNWWGDDGDAFGSTEERLPIYFAPVEGETPEERARFEFRLGLLKWGFAVLGFALFAALVVKG